MAPPGAIPRARPFLWGLTLIAFLYPCSGNRGRYQARFNPIGRFDTGSMKTQRVQPDVFAIENESGTLDAVLKSKKLAPKVLSDLMPTRAASPKPSVWKKKKRWAPNIPKRNPLKERTTRFESEVERRLKPVDKQDFIAKKFRRQVCMTGNEDSRTKKIQNSVVRKRIVRCAITSFSDGKEHHLEAGHSKGSKEKETDQGETTWVRSPTHHASKGLTLRLKGKRRRRQATDREKQPFGRHDSSYSLYSYFTPSRTQSRREKRSFSNFHKKENSLEDAFLISTLEDGRSERRKTNSLRKIRETESKEALSVETVHLALKALQTQRKLSEMVEQLSDPSSRVSRKEKVSDMRELSDELKLFIKLLQEQILLQSLNEVQDLTTITAPSDT